MDEKRRLPRKYLIIFSRVFERTLGKLLGYLSDLSESGGMIISEEPMQVGTTVSLRLDLPDPKIFHAHNLQLEARVARCDPDLSPAFYDIGIEFLDVTPEKKILIQRMMEVYEFHREDEPSSGTSPI
ncbi:MAG: PilZ domain-containing protein [Chloroflexi bacterium]|nr:PilZ domain-containing protein [Chloroflexota bacterium]